MAKRYTRAAWPDEFNHRLEAIAKRLETLFKGPAAAVVSALYIDLEPPEAEISVNEPFMIVSLWIVVPESVRTDLAIWELARGFEERVGQVFRSCPGIELGEADLRSEQDVTLADIRILRRFDRDYRSLSPEKEQPVEE
jgi:hypothetical protein